MNKTNYWVQCQDENITIECYHIADAVAVKNSIIEQYDTNGDNVIIYYKDFLNTPKSQEFTLIELE